MKKKFSIGKLNNSNAYQQIIQCNVDFKSIEGHRVVRPVSIPLAYKLASKESDNRK